MGDIEAIRLDKWLWAARFYKTRQLAQQAINGGKIRYQNARVKCAQTVRINDEIRIRKRQTEWTVIVKGLSSRRGSAERAQQLYEETTNSTAKRQALSLQQRLSHNVRPKIRPNKKARRDIRRLTGKSE